MQNDTSYFMEEVKNMGREKYTEYLKDKYEVNTITENDRITTVGGKDHLYTWERIYHFSCGNCRNWWSYATTEGLQGKSRKMTCPHCGQYSAISPNPDLDELVTPI